MLAHPHGHQSFFWEDLEYIKSGYWALVARAKAMWAQEVFPRSCWWMGDAQVKVVAFRESSTVCAASV